MSSPEYLRRHYGVVPPKGEDPRFSTPENLGRRTAAVTGIYEAHSADLKLDPTAEPETPAIQVVSVKDPVIAGTKQWSIGISPDKASGAKTLKVSDFLTIPEYPPKVYNVPKETPE